VIRLGPFYALVACSGGAGDAPPTETGDDTDEPTDTDPPECESELRITHAEGGCFGYPDQWDFKVDNAGCAVSARVAMWDTVALDWDEEHPMALGSEGPDRIWQNWTLYALPHATPRDGWQAGVNTSFDCDAQSASVTLAARLLDADGATVACAIWGHDPDAVLSGDASAVNATAADYAGCQVQPF
jgi:hypothetical protein